MSVRGIVILVVSCDRYNDPWEPFFKCFFKYWPDCPFKIYLGTNHKVLTDSRVTTLAIGKDKSYSENLRAMLACIPERWVIFWVDDRFISGSVQTAEVTHLAQSAQEMGAAYLKLIPEHPMAYETTESGIGLIPKGTFYRVSMTIALWEKGCLEKLLVPGESAWQLEKNGMLRSADLEAPFFGLTRNSRRHPPIPHVHILMKGRLIRSAFQFIENEGLRSSFRFRRLQTLSSQAYAFLFHMVLRFLAPVADKIIRYQNSSHRARK